jgi:hypothetical protein
MKEIAMLPEKEILQSADDRIQQHRMSDVIVKVIDSEGSPVPDAGKALLQV